MTNAEKVCNVINKIFEDNIDSLGEAKIKKENGKEMIYIDFFIGYWDSMMTVAKIDGTNFLFLDCKNGVSYPISFLNFFEEFPDKYENITEEVEEKLIDNPKFVLELPEDSPILIDYCKCLLEFIYFTHIQNIGDLASTALGIREQIKTITKRTTSFKKDIEKIIESDVFYF